MFEETHNELEIFESKLNALPMYPSDRAVAMSALGKGFVLVERAAWAAQKIQHLAAVWARPRVMTQP